MPTELEELVEFLHHGNTQIRQIACENLVEYSLQSSVFKNPHLAPIQDLKLLVRDYPPIAKNALTILVNLTHDEEILANLGADDVFLETILKKITDVKEPNANEIAMLLANMAKCNAMDRLIKLKRSVPAHVSTSEMAMDQLMDCFVKGAQGKINSKANYDYLAYLMADLSKHKAGREYFSTRQSYDNVIPITKLTVFTEHSSNIRRKGVASTIKNIAFEVDSHSMLLDSDGANLLPYILLPLAGNEDFSDEDSAGMLADLQLLPPDKQRDGDNEILITHLETLLLLTTTREGREIMRQVKVYPIIRECHLHSDDDDVRAACERLVQVLMRDEEDVQLKPPNLAHDETKGNGDEDNKITEIF